MKAYRVKGTTNDVTTCELCGRDELKGTVVLIPLDADGNVDGDPVHFGTSCAAKAAGWTLKETNRRIKDARDAQRELERAERNAAWEAQNTWVTGWCLESYGTADFHKAAKIAGMSAPRLSGVALDAYKASQTGDATVNAAEADGETPYVRVSNFLVQSRRGAPQIQLEERLNSFGGVSDVVTEIPGSVLAAAALTAGGVDATALKTLVNEPVTVWEMTADEWNAAHPVGTPVVAYPGVRPEHPAFGPDTTRLETTTRTPAWTLGHGTAVVSVEGYAGGITLTHIDVVPEAAALRFDVGSKVHVACDVNGHLRNTNGVVTAIFPGDPHPYGVDSAGVYGRFAGGEVDPAEPVNVWDLLVESPRKTSMSIDPDEMYDTAPVVKALKEMSLDALTERGQAILDGVCSRVRDKDGRLYQYSLLISRELVKRGVTLQATVIETAPVDVPEKHYAPGADTNHFMGRCLECDAHYLAGMNMGRVQDWYRQGVFSQMQYEAYMHAWTTSATRHSVGDWTPIDAETAAYAERIKEAGDR